MKREPLVSIVMNCYNGDEYLRESIDSVINQTYRNWEIIFWDNQSTDNSSQIARSYKDSRIKYFFATSHTPLGLARNLAIEKASGEFIAFLDCDDLWFDSKLIRQIELFQDPEVVLVYSDSIFFDENGDKFRLYSRTAYATGKCFRQLLSNYYLSLETVIVRHSSLLEMETLFDERFNMIEEADLFRRLALKGKLAMINEPLAKWRIHQNSWTWQKTELLWIENELMLEEYVKLIDNFETIYADEIKILRNGMQWEKLKYLIKNDKYPEARQEVKKLVFGLRKVFTYFIIYSPRFFYKFLRKKIFIG
ncbi:glycosyltransferase family 2 protein [Leptospira kanakyensis]|uniref:glycosyltransferase family 2 protein n=1 Tax=Leptospira kanakyensis TaxID=2484968 RepID=UPI00223E37B2|nr:glycosyltransferase [Leptospira kanakyensis]MCW7482118.1 glycosyltransferase [Leptospira kanakyensis]